MSTVFAIIFGILLVCAGLSFIYILTVRAVWNCKFATYRLVDFIKSKKTKKSK